MILSQNEGRASLDFININPHFTIGKARCTLTRHFTYAYGEWRHTLLVAFINREEKFGISFCRFWEKLFDVISHFSAQFIVVLNGFKEKPKKYN